MKNKLIPLFPILFLGLSGAAFADLNFKFYSGLYIGADWDREISNGMITLGGDLQMGFEIGEFYYDDFVFGFLGNVGIDTGQPNEPNFYYGGMAEFYFGGDEIKIGTALGIGSNTGFSILKSGGSIRDSLYLRVGLPSRFENGMKYGFYYDYYFDVGSRMGLLFHF
jgi:hypothetical protein